ncbi:hypothetical protein CAPTEDRAFT_201833 [Capitella teleta]|uniref:Uncharacterized protein n=1 Tax=Capitella teleta TaxID=283909 RepID=R7UID5_CAPTE|nr:hypothetical protein CAPTEDRAFT_201833 [Capitella teleta]|eukprot:ELU03012.1 hypothetical protein CAPTEDRAFT_201833 [Capitella teleta]
MATTSSFKKGKSQVKRSNHERVGVGGGQTILVKSHNAPPSYKPCRVKPFNYAINYAEIAGSEDLHQHYELHKEQYYGFLCVTALSSFAAFSCYLFSLVVVFFDSRIPGKDPPLPSISRCSMPLLYIIPTMNAIFFLVYCIWRFSSPEVFEYLSANALNF